MRITQAYVSKSVMDFPFHQIYSLDDYNNDHDTAIFFGMYRYEDSILAYNHGGICIIFWTGQDALTFGAWSVFSDYKLYRHVTAHPKVKEHLKAMGMDCQLVPPSTFLNHQQPQRLGDKIYAYCPNSAPDYHGKKVIDELRTAGYEIIIGDGQWTQDQWRMGKADWFYNDVFIGLCLSEFAGGGTSIIEMGLRGIPVVTNVFQLPHCIPWHDAQHIAAIIQDQKKLIGTAQKKLAQSVWESLDHEFKWMEI